MLVSLIRCVLALTLPLAIACSDDTSSQSQAPSPTATVNVPEATPVPSAAPSGTKTGIAGIDQVIEAIQADDLAKLAQLFQLYEIACTNVPGVGGPPKCSQAGNVPDGTRVRSFPSSACELGWSVNVQPIADHLLSFDPRLFGVVEFTMRLSFANEPGLIPPATHGVILETDTAGGRQGIMVHVNNGRVVYLDFLCFGPPEVFLATHPLSAGSSRLILRGPAFR